MDSKFGKNIGLSAACLLAACSAMAEELIGEKKTEAQMTLELASKELGASGITLAPGITLAGLFEISTVYEKQSDNKSNVNVDTVEFALNAEFCETVRAEAVALWEEGSDEDSVVDTAFVEFGGSDDFPLVVSVGRQYLPFGAFNSLMISDPLTLELGETRETAVAASCDVGRFALWAGVFSGEIDSVDAIENGVASLIANPTEGLSFGFSVLSDLGEGGYVDTINAVLADEGVYHKSGGMSAFFLAEYNAFIFSAEYLCALEEMVLEKTESRNAMQPSAWFVDVGYVFNDKWTAALRYEGSRDFLAEEMPKTQVGGMIRWQVNDLASISTEYLYGQFDNDEIDDRHIATVQLVLMF